MKTAQRRPSKAGAADTKGDRAQNRIRALTSEQIRIQGAVVAVVYFVALAWLQVPQLPAVVHAFVLWVLLASLLALLVVLSHRSARAVSSAYLRAIRELEQELHDLSFRENASLISDKMTGAYTYEYLLTRLKEEVDRASRHGRAMTLILVDLADFSRVNQQYGRATGNQILRRFALNILRPVVRSADVVARYGGDEFAVLLTETGPQGGSVVVNRIVEAASRGTVLPDGTRLPLPITVGVATFPQDALTPQDLVQAAERALLKGKAAASAS